MASLLIGALPIPSQSSHLSFSQSRTLSTSLSSFTPSLSLPAVSSASLPSVYCGRGDRKTERGKRFSHSFGNARPRNKNKGRGPPRAPIPPSPPRKDKFDNDDKIKIEIDESISSTTREGFGGRRRKRPRGKFVP